MGFVKHILFLEVKPPRWLDVVQQAPILILSYVKVCESLDFASRTKEVQ